MTFRLIGLSAVQASGFRRASQAFETMNMSLEPVDLSGLDDDAYVWALKDVWTTYNGSWEDSSGEWGCPAWAKEDYLTPGDHPCYFDDAGGDHHIFAALLPEEYDGGNVGCDLLKEANIVYWTDPNDLVGVNTKAHNGWANVVMYASSSFFPDQGQTGPWRWTRGGGDFGRGDVLHGAGMPYQHHVSTFAVWQKMTVARYKEVVLGDEPVVPPVVPPVEPPEDGEVTDYLSAILTETNLLREHLGA